MVITAVKFPSVVGFVAKATVSKVAAAVVTMPTAPLLKATVLLAAVRSKPKPLMSTVFAFTFWLLELLVTTGMTVAV